MAEGDVTIRPGTEGGQVGGTPDGGQTSPAAPVTGGDGQLSQGPGQGTTTDGAGTQTPPDDSFFDPRDLEGKPELLAAYKNMQRAYTQKMQAIKEQRQKIDAYDAFYTNPQAEVQRLLNQWGYQMTPAGQQALAQQQNGNNEPWQPQSWDEVISRAKQEAQQEIMEQMKPFFGQFKDLRQSTIESQLSEIDPAWHQYEDAMKRNLQSHPTLANDPAKLYQISVPPEVLESRATQAALKKLDAQKQSANISGGSTTTKTPPGGLPDKPVSFEDAVNAAKKVLAEQGITPGSQ